MVLKDVTIEIAPGVKYAPGASRAARPGPVVHARQGQTVEMTLTNDGAIPHSIDFHAARIAPNLAFVDVMPGKSFTFRFKANDPGVFMYHCGTKPVLMHIANGMYGAIVVDPATPLPKADRSYVLVASEWYLYEETTGTLFCGDISQEPRRPGVRSDDDPVAPAIEAEDLFHGSSLHPTTGTTLRTLAELEPQLLAVMHGPSYTGDGGAGLRALADSYESTYLSGAAG